MRMRASAVRFSVGVLVAVVVGMVSVSPVSAAPSVSRRSGADRFETAAAISAAAFSPGVPVAFLATGDSFPDALAAGPAAARLGGPVLLTAPGSLPAATGTELGRLKPAKITILGGTSSVSQGVEGQVQQYTTGAVARVNGADRYATAAALSASTFPASTATVYVATGQNFPDALAGGPAVASVGGPILLVPGTGTIPAVVTSELGRLAAHQIVVLGGTSSVDDGVTGQLAAYSAQPVNRRSGADRYLTSVAVSQGAFGSASTVYLASGHNYPDALAGGAPAGIAHAPVLLVDTNCIPAAVNDEITRLAPTSIVILGGTSSVSASVGNRQVCTGPPFTIGEGNHTVGGSGVPAGTYRTRTPVAGCYWERLKGFSGNSSDIIANNFSDDVQVVTIQPTDAGFNNNGCGPFTNDLSAITPDPNAPFGPGTLIVNTDIAPGTWTAPGGSECYWERDSGFGGSTADIITNDFGTTNPIVTIASTDAGFSSNGCGTWTRTG